MTPEEVKRMNELVLLIQAEKDYLKFGELVDELNALLDERELRFPTPAEVAGVYSNCLNTFLLC